jgi:lipopolysaccharide biosynthesis protein
MKLLVHLHVFYHDEVPWFLERLRYLDAYDWDLVITFREADPVMEETVRAFKPDARFLYVENVGYDVWPFLKMLSQVDLTPYDIVFKLHTKTVSSSRTVRINGVHMRKETWRNILVDALLASPEQVRRVVSVFQEQPDAGMVCSDILYVSLGFPEDGKMLTEELDALGLLTEERRFCVGNMFAIRPCLFAPLRKRDFSPEQFPAQSKSGSGGTLAHVYERIFSLLAPAQGYKVVTCDSDLEAGLLRKRRVKQWFKPVLAFLFNLDWEGSPRRKVLTILGLKFTLSS